MKTQIHNKLELRKYLDKLDPSRIPSNQEIDEAVEKRLTKAHITLKDLPEGETIQTGDTAMLRTESVLPKFNKAKVPVTVGTNLYDRELETVLVGRKVGERGQLDKDGEPVTYEILSAKRKLVPDVTDAMAAEQGIEGVDTVEKFRAHLAKEKTDFALGGLAGEVMEAMLRDAETDEPADEDLDRLGELESAFFKKLYLEKDGINVDQLTEEEFREKLHCGSFEEFVQMRREWYQIKVKYCLAFSSVLGIPLEGEYDPMERYEAMSDMQGILMERIKEDLLRRKG